MQADNVFRHTAYEGAVDIEAVADRTERVALEMQARPRGCLARAGRLPPGRLLRISCRSKQHRSDCGTGALQCPTGF